MIFAALLLGLVVPWVLGLADREMGASKPLFRGRGWAIAAMVLIGIDLGVRAVEHHRALGLVSQCPVWQPGDDPCVALMPYPVNPFHWFAVVETSGYDQMGSVDTARRNGRHQ